MHRRNLVTLFLVLAPLVASSADPVNQRPAENYYRAGVIELQRGNLSEARDLFSRALINARKGYKGGESEAQVLSKLGRVHGNLCEHDAAGKAFLEARDLDIKAYGSDSPRTFPIRLELAQWAYDIGQFENAAKYFAEAFAVGGARLKESDPATYIATAKDYADALARVGKADQAKQVLAEAAAAGNAPGIAKVAKGADYERYPKSCK